MIKNTTTQRIMTEISTIDPPRGVPFVNECSDDKKRSSPKRIIEYMGLFVHIHGLGVGRWLVWQTSLIQKQLKKAL